MLRKRLIFALIYSDGAFMQSRNFRLQRVGDISWLEKNYKFQNISFSLDELIVVDASKNSKSMESFAKVVKRLVGDVFIPVAAGGGIKKMEDAELLFCSGSDKIIINSSLDENPELLRSIINKYGAQSLVASVDYKIINNEPIVFTKDGTFQLTIKLNEYLEYLQELGVGEVLLNSINQDGTGFGYDLPTVREISKNLTVPLLIMGGAGNERHLLEGLTEEGVSAVVTANLFNFIGSGLPNARKFMLEHDANLAVW